MVCATAVIPRAQLATMTPVRPRNCLVGWRVRNIVRSIWQPPSGTNLWQHTVPSAKSHLRQVGSNRCPRSSGFRSSFIPGARIRFETYRFLFFVHPGNLLRLKSFGSDKYEVKPVHAPCLRELAACRAPWVRIVSSRPTSRPSYLPAKNRYATEVSTMNSAAPNV